MQHGDLYEQVILNISCQDEDISDNFLSWGWGK